MARQKTITPLGEAITEVQQRCDIEMYKIKHASALLKLLALQGEENHFPEIEAAWHTAEYLADRLAEHTEALEQVSVAIDQLSMRVRHGGTSPPPARPRIDLVQDTGGDAA